MQLNIDEVIKSMCSLDVALLESFQATKREFAPGKPPSTIAMADLARATLGCMGKLTRQQRAAIFQVIEKGLLDGDETTKDAIATGFLETLQSQLPKSTLDAGEVYGLLQPKSKEYCLEWDRFNGIES